MNFTVKFINDLLTDEKAKSNTLSIHLLGAIQEAKLLKQLFLIIIIYSNSRVLDLNLQLVVQDSD